MNRYEAKEGLKRIENKAKEIEGLNDEDWISIASAIRHLTSDLSVPTEKQFVSRLKDLHESEVVCDNCEKAVKTTFYPYGYDEEEHDMWYIGVCPECGEVMYVKD